MKILLDDKVIEDGQTLVIPADVLEVLRTAGPVEWGSTEKQTDEKHVSDLEDTLRLTREYFDGMPAETAMHGVYLAGTGVVLAHTGTSPNSPQHARIIAGLWNTLVVIAEAQRTSGGPSDG
jgi:hypothetical protein